MHFLIHIFTCGEHRSTLFTSSQFPKCSSLLPKVDTMILVHSVDSWAPTMTSHCQGPPGLPCVMRQILGPLSLIKHFLCAQSCPTLCDHMDCRPPGSSDHGISQARILEWVALSHSRGSSQPRFPMLAYRLNQSTANMENPISDLAI